MDRAKSEAANAKVHLSRESLFCDNAVFTTTPVSKRKSYYHGRAAMLVTGCVILTIGMSFEYPILNAVSTPQHLDG